MEYFVYILQSEKNSSYYIGQTKDIPVRLTKHNNGEVQYTKPNRPWKLVYHEKFKTRSGAVIREREIKSHKKRKFIENLITSRNVAQPG
ncbi:MAG: GIY-YIG nuclease family protein [Bacteroidetes bacterium]|nr:GIY-YIG nuclease family protein [Bacteroidota bacterium]MBU1422681.1 GIY-YIG nuclease family protein [Bacteroidota bacterium]MBU2637036.1 GIY-YIG nuclease family protein [Bacteroidota bacterium]